MDLFLKGVIDMQQILETERLILRELVRSDLAALSAIIQDEETMIAYNEAMSDGETLTWLEKQITRYRQDGFGLWAVILKENMQMIGQCGITLQPVEDNVVTEIGYLFNRSYWHNGYAVEAAKACRDYAFQRLGIKEVYSIVRDINISSMNVAIRNGMVIRKRFIKTYRGEDMPHFLFSVRQ